MPNSSHVLVPPSRSPSARSGTWAPKPACTPSAALPKACTGSPFRRTAAVSWPVATTGRSGAGVQRGTGEGATEGATEGGYNGGLPGKVPGNQVPPPLRLLRRRLRAEAPRPSLSRSCALGFFLPSFFCRLSRFRCPASLTWRRTTQLPTRRRWTQTAARTAREPPCRARFKRTLQAHASSTRFKHTLQAHAALCACCACLLACLPACRGGVA